MSRIWELWQCPRCGRLEEVDIADYLEIGTPMCPVCGSEPNEMSVEMNRYEQ